MQTGNVAWPDCFRTFGLLGADSSFSIAHFAVPLPVCVAVQPDGGAPALASSKLIVSATAAPDRRAMEMISVYIVFIVVFANCCLGSFALKLAAPALLR